MASVDPAGPGRKAGLKAEDVVLEMNGAPVGDIFEMQSVIAATRPGSPMTLKIIRDGQTREVVVVMGQSPTTPPPMRADSETRPRMTLGIKVRTLSGDLAKRVGLEGTDGVIVVDVATGGIAEESGLEVGDVITQMNGQTIASDKEFAGLVDKVPAGGIMVLRVIQDGSPRIIGLKRD